MTWVRWPSPLVALAFLCVLTSAAPGQAPGAATPAPPPPAPLQSADPFGREATLVEKDIVYFKGNATWDTAFETLVDAFKTVYGFLEKQGVKPAGPAMTIYTATDDTGFTFQAAVPIAEPLANPPTGDIAAGKSPGGMSREFVHRGSYDSLDNTYEAITNFLDEKNLEAKDMFIEEYKTDLRTTPEDKLVIHVFVPIR